MEFIDSIWFTVLLGVAGWVLIYIKTEQQKGGSMQLRKFLSKNTPKKDKIRILEKMLKVAESNGGTISVKKAREVIRRAIERRQHD